jgi:hypothetical protein
MSQFGDFQNAVVDGAKILAVQTVGDFATQAQDDAREFLQQTQQKLQTWTTLLKDGEITELEFTALVESQGGLAALRALKLAGIAAASLQRFRDGLMKLVVDSAFKVFLP